MYRTLILASLSLVVSLSFARPVAASLIDFETTPAAGTPVDDTPLAAPYNITGGGTVQFFFDNNADDTLNVGDDPAIFEQINQDGNDAFSNAVTGVADTASSASFAAQLGTFFLRAVAPGPPPNPFIIDYNTSQTITALSGEIWDIDGQPLNTERWQVDVLDGANVVVATLLSPIGNSTAMDGEPWTFAFTGLPAGVDKVRLTFVGSKTQNVGLAFNNFSPTIALPEPSALALLVVGAVPLVVMVARSRRRFLQA